MSVSLDSALIGVCLAQLYWVGVILGGTVTGTLSAVLPTAAGFETIVILGWLGFEIVGAPRVSRADPRDVLTWPPFVQKWTQFVRRWVRFARDGDA